MYNSEDAYNFEDGRQSQSNQPSLQMQKNQRINNSRPKNIINPSQKGNGISGTYSRIVPKKPLHDYERLYAQNIQLRQKIRFLEQDNMKTKTRVSMVQKQKQQLINQICNMDNNISMKQRRTSQHSFQKHQQQKSKKVVQDQNRRILHGYKDQISKLKLQNNRLKKTVKYTQIQELQVQNKNLHQQMTRLKLYTQDIINNIQYEQYQKQIQALNQKLQGEKDQVKHITMQMKKKDDQIEQVKSKMKVLVARKTELQKKYTRDINSVKSQLHRVKQKQIISITQQKKQNTKNIKQSKPTQCKQCNNLKSSITSDKQKIKQLQNNISLKDRQIQQLKNKIKQQQHKNKLPKQQKSPKIDQSNRSKKQQNLVQATQAHNKQDKAKSNQRNQLQIQKQKQKQKQSQKLDDKVNQSPKKVQKKKSKQNQYQDQEQYDEFDQEQNANSKKDNVQQSQDKVDVLYVDLKNDKKNKQQNVDKKQNKKHTQEPDYEQYQESFNDKGIQDIQKQFKNEQSEEQVLFQKQQQPKQKKKQAPTKKQIKQKQQKQSHKQKQGGSSSKAEKILKQTIKYRLIAQRYTYNDFNRDIKDSGATEFSVQQVIQMMSNEPFFLNQEHLQMVVYGLYQKEQLEATDIIKSNIFLKKMRNFISDFDLQDEAQQQHILKQIQKKLTKKKILPKFKQEAQGEQISKKGFVKVLKEIGGLSQEQVQQSLAEASILSVDIAHINYKQFYSKLTGSS